MVSIAQITESQVSDVRKMIAEYLAWTRTFMDGSETAPTFASVDDELANLPGIFSPPKGRLLVGLVDGYVAGCVALKSHGDEVCELKRLYVRAAFRGHNLGRVLVQTLIDEARHEGYTKMILDTHKSMVQAHAVYRGLGFRDVPAPRDFPANLKDIALFMEMDLAAPG